MGGGKKEKTTFRTTFFSQDLALRTEKTEKAHSRVTQSGLDSAESVASYEYPQFFSCRCLPKQSIYLFS